MWHCPHCSEELSATFLVCWKCGTSRDGVADPSFVAVVDDELAPVTPPVKTFHQRTIVSLLVSTGLTILFLQFSNMIVASISAVTIVAIVIGLISSGELRERLVASSICFAMLLPCIICFSAIYRTIF